MVPGWHPASRPAGLLISQACEQFCTHVPPSRWEKIISHICMKEISRKNKSMWFYHCHAQLGKIDEVGMGIFSFPSYFGQNSIVISEKSQGHQCGVTQFMTPGVLHVLASDLAFQVIILYRNICATAAESALYSPWYSGMCPGWNNLSRTQMDHIHIKKYMRFFYFLFQPFTLGKVVFTPLLF